MAGISMGGMALLLLVNLSPYGPPEVCEGAFWTYAFDQQEWAMRVVEVSPGEAGTSLQVEVSMNGTSLPLRVLLSHDRRSLTLQGVTSGDRDQLCVYLPELEPGARLQPPDEAAATVTKVQPLPRSTPAGDFPDAIEVSLAVEDQPEGTMWLAPGVGLLAFAADGTTMMELLDYGPRSAFEPPGSQLAPPQDLPSLPTLTSSAFAPALTALDENTFVVADPATRTVTVFLLLRSDAGHWRIETKAVAPYGLSVPSTASP